MQCRNGPSAHKKQREIWCYKKRASPYLGAEQVLKTEETLSAVFYFLITKVFHHETSSYQRLRFSWVPYLYKILMFFIVQINWLENRYLLSEQVLGTCLGTRDNIASGFNSCVCVCVGERETERETEKGTGVQIRGERKKRCEGVQMCSERHFT